MLGIGGAIAVFGALAEPYRRERVLAFMNPWSDPLNTGYQTIQSLMAMGSGGFFGVGIGASRQKWLYVPNAHTDFIYAIIGEEMGLLGTLTVLGMFAFLAYLGIRIARHAPDRFGMLLAGGVTAWIVGQATVNIGAVVGLLPITGVPLPFISDGGSALVVTLAAVGILASFARAEPDVLNTVAAAAGLAVQQEMNPRLSALVPSSPTGPMECQELMALDFRAHYFRGDRKKEVDERVRAIVSELGVSRDEMAEAPTNE